MSSSLELQVIMTLSDEKFYGLLYFNIYNDLVSLLRLRLNTIQTYVPWNFHELDFEGNVIDFNGERNLLLFLDLAAKYNLFVLLRPGPCK